MAASASPEGASSQKVTTASATVNGITVNSFNSGGNSSSNKNGTAVPETDQSLRHDPGISTEWSSDEQSALEDLLIKYASYSNIVKYAKIAMDLKDKTVRDIALRCRWMTRKENGKRRKEDHSSRKNKDRKEKNTDSSGKSSYLPTKSNGTYAQPLLPADNDDGISFEAIGGVTGDILKQNSQFLNQISANFSSYQFHENITLLRKARDNILTVLNDVSSASDMPEIMKQMPPLPVKLNQELANCILPVAPRQVKPLSDHSR